MTTRTRGLGSVYQRGDTWWIKFYVDGKAKRESSGSDKQSKAVTLLKRRLEELSAGLDASERTLRRARKAAGIVAQRHGFGPGSAMVWSLGNGHPGHIPAIPDTPGEMADMAGMGRYDDPDRAARDAMREGA